MREKFCKHPSTNAEHGLEQDQASAGMRHEQIHKQCSHNQVCFTCIDLSYYPVFLGLLPRKCALGLAAGLELICIYLLSVLCVDERQFAVKDNAQELSFLYDRNGGTV